MVWDFDKRLNEIMKPFCAVIAVVALLSFQNLYADSQRDRLKERQEISKMSKKELNEKASKAARKEAKKLEKEGWLSAPGALPIEKQLDKSYTMQYEYDYEGYPKFIMAEGMSTAGNYDAAKMHALELAKQNLTGQIQTEVVALIDNTVSNRQMDQSDATSIAESVLAGRNTISQKLGRVVIVTEMYRVVNGRNREVLVRIAYSGEKAKDAAKEAVKNDLEKKGRDLNDELERLFGQ